MASANPIQVTNGITTLRFIGLTSRTARRGDGKMGADYQAAFDVALQSGATVRRVLSIPDFELDRAQAKIGRSMIEKDVATGLPVADVDRLERLFHRRFNSANISLSEISVGSGDLEEVLRS